MSATATAVAAPRPVHPDRVEYAGRQAAIGPKGYALLVHVVACGGRAKLVALGPAVYGEAEVTRNRIEVQCHRVNRRLRALGCPHQLCVIQGEVTLT